MTIYLLFIYTKFMIKRIFLLINNDYKREYYVYSIIDDYQRRSIVSRHLACILEC